MIDRLSCIGGVVEVMTMPDYHLLEVEEDDGYTGLIHQYIFLIISRVYAIC
jgi:hypothetical protein